MRLKQIKLAGFKSFVDATIIPFKHTMTAIVGPNGCGKSNVIDAVRWVLGESSAKNLRGDAMSDVIFNGAASRKPISQASVELIFENVAQQLTDKVKGSSANRNEIAIRRVVNREGSNSYFLNGTKCRRRDITDIFLGTGLGPRSYAIIEQGTISRLIESKPQELRTFIEEAAGISKYKERRKETENSIRHTRENLARLGDIRAELLIQIDKLHQQAEAAKRFTDLKQQERKHKAELAAMRWQQFDEKVQQYQRQLSQAEQEVASLNLLLKQYQFEIENIKQQNNVDDYQLKDLHLKKVQLTEKIAKIEQSIKFTKQQQQQFEKVLLDIDKELLSAEHVLAKDNQSQQQTQSSHQKSEPKLAALHKSITSKQLQLNEALKAQQKLQQYWQQLNSEQAKQRELHNTVNNHIDRQQSLIKRSEQQLSAFELQIKEITTQQVQINDQILNETQFVKDNQQLTDLEKQLKISHDYIAQQQRLFVKKQQQLAKSQGIEQSLNQQINQLSLQLTGDSDWSEQQKLWFEQQSLTAIKTLHQVIIIDEKWQFAVEQVLSYWLQAVIIDNLHENASCSFTDKLVELSALDYALLITSNHNKNGANDSSINKGSLAELLIDSGVFLPLWNDIFLANDLTEAKTLLTDLAEHQSVLCPDSAWIGHNFIRKGHVESSAQLHLLEKESELNKLKQQLCECQQSQNVITDEQKVIQVNIEQQQHVLQKQQADLNSLQQKIQTFQQKNALIEQQRIHLSQQQQKLENAYQQGNKLLQNEQALLVSYLTEQQQLKPIENDQAEQENIVSQRDALQKSIDFLQEKVQQMQDERHQLAVKVEQEKAEQKHLNTNIERYQQQLEQLQQQKQQVKKSQQETKASSIAEQEQLNDWLTQMLALDESLQDTHVKQSEIEQKLASFEQVKQNVNEKLDKAKQQLSKSQIALENNKVRAQANLEQLAELQQNLTQVLAELPKHAQETLWQAILIKLSKDINQLGAINLAAISEYEQQLQRKNYLDLQSDDLTDALSTLESAIATIDKESKQKFKATFEQVNVDLQKLFPKVFDGGSAYLTLTGDDLLEAGVTIMARPPGKKNSTIHLLSGGEKALTALSLVFAIFRLNPAPFCLLDEVDAPLDDANVARFCNLVQEMSQTVQFIYISHNKIAMEMASHLTGVTMFEPGVSKMVAVDIDEAVAMAELA